MKKRNRKLYVEPLDSYTGQVLFRNFERDPVLMSVHAPRPKHLMELDLDELMKVKRSKADLDLKFRVWSCLEGEKPRPDRAHNSSRKLEVAAAVGKMLRDVRSIRRKHLTLTHR
jgi:hypothetical protein